MSSEELALTREEGCRHEAVPIRIETVPYPAYQISTQEDKVIAFLRNIRVAIHCFSKHVTVDLQERTARRGANCTALIGISVSASIAG